MPNRVVNRGIIALAWFLGGIAWIAPAASAASHHGKHASAHQQPKGPGGAGSGTTVIPKSGHIRGTHPATRPAGRGAGPTRTFLGHARVGRGKMISYDNGLSRIHAYWIAPKGGGPFPAIIAVHDVFGLTPWMRNQCRILASHGYAVLAPNLYTRDNVSNGCRSAKQAAQCYHGLSDQRAVSDLMAAVKYLHASPKVQGRRIGVVGYDMGGIYAMMLASDSLRVKAAVNFYGQLMYGDTTTRHPISPVENVFNLRAPLLSFYGNRDPQNPPPVLKLFRHRLAFNPNKAYYRLFIFKGVGHGFLVPNRQGYSPVAADQAMEKTFSFLRRILKAPRHRRRHHDNG